MTHFQWIAISTNRFSVETYLYGFTRVWEWFHWMRVEILRSLGRYMGGYGDPLMDLGILQDPEKNLLVIMKGGRLYKQLL